MQQQIIDIDPSKSIRESVQALQIPPRPLIILLGTCDAPLNDQIRSVCSRVIAPIALDPGSLILDDGCSACASLIGQAAADQDQMASLLAIVPHEQPAPQIDPNHQLVLRLPSSWTDTSKMMFQVADALLEHEVDQKPALVILCGGGDAETKALIRAAKRGWPVLVLKGTGGLSDAIADALGKRAAGTVLPASLDPGLREIIETAQLYTWSVMGGSVDDLNRIVLGRIELRSKTAAAILTEAWHRFDNIDIGARERQTHFRRMELFLIILAVMAALFAILSQVATTKWPQFLSQAHIHILVILIPIAISITAAYNSHFRDGNKWILLRGAAETMKREIFRFRAKAGVYSDAQCLQSSRESKLAARIADITLALEQSEVNKIGLTQQPSGDPKRANFLAPEEYVEERLQDQIKYFTGKTRRLSDQLISMQLLIYIVGGTGTFLAAIKLDVWVALTTAIVTALATKLQADQVETSLVQYNQALVGLKNIITWWDGLSAWEKKRPNNIDVLVDQTEKALESEMAGWVQQMQSALDKLTEKEPTQKASAASAG
jgi:SMODS and SLOG-associating 2TM effector domain 1/SLOG in TRPM, prokaryote/Protein of unknown function (DUF4231)